MFNYSRIKFHIYFFHNNTFLFIMVTKITTKFKRCLSIFLLHFLPIVIESITKLVITYNIYYVLLVVPRELNIKAAYISADHFLLRDPHIKEKTNLSHFLC